MQKKDYIIFPRGGLNSEIIVDGGLAQLNMVAQHTYVKKGQDVYIKYHLDKGNNSMLTVTLFDIDRYEKAMEKLSKQTFKAEKNHKLYNILKGKIDVKEDGILFTSIEYEKGMKVYVDGKKVNHKILLNTFIGLDLKKGNHTIEIKYIPKGLIPGFIISIFGLILAIIWKKQYNCFGEQNEN